MSADSLSTEAKPTKLELLNPYDEQSGPPDMMSLLQIALSRDSGIDVIERLVALKERETARIEELEFNEALNRVQEKIKRIAPDLNNSSKNSKYASYAAIDRVIRPLYTSEGFSISYTHADCTKNDYIRVIAWLRRKGHKEPYQVDWPVDTKGPKGGDVMTPTQATGASDSYAKRYLVKDIFNIAIGEDDNDGNITMDEAADFLTLIKESRTLDELDANYRDARKDALRLDRDPKVQGKAIELYGVAFKTRRAELNKA